MAHLFGAVTALLSLHVCSAACLQSRQADVNEHLTAVADYVDSIAEDLWPINTKIFDNPELGYEEFIAHETLTDFMESHEGWNVTRSIYGVETAFVAIYEGSGDGPVVSFNAEYDALPGLGHACGHNLIAMASVSGALAAAEIVRNENLGGKVILFGTPAEESLGGKVRLLEAGAFSDHEIDISLITHPTGATNGAYMQTLSTDRFDVEYYGKAAHAAAAPWEGVNAQDALILAYNAISMLRQQSKSSEMIHGFISGAGERTNIIPDLATATFQIRATDDEELADWTKRLEACFEAGAVGTGAELNFTLRPYGYSAMNTNKVLADTYRTWFNEIGGQVGNEIDETVDGQSSGGSGGGGGSTDQGNIAQDFPSISPVFVIPSNGSSIPVAHTAGFEAVAGTRGAFDAALNAGKALAGVAVEVLTVDGLLDEVKEVFEASRAGNSTGAARHRLRRAGRRV